MKNQSIKKSMSQDLVTINWNARMQEASELMEENRIRHLPVTDEGGVIVGILSNRDVNRAMSPKKPGFSPESSVSEYMSWPVVTVDQGLTLKDAAQGMIDEKISAFLVTSDTKEIVGIVTSEDLLKAFAALLSAPGPLTRLSYSPVVGELLREAQSAGL